ncbi:MAG: NADH:flavin oxidoreductase/NADH oxidase [Rhodobacteraceae bacterium]|uniref:NADH:flavin oxidoreductase n=1 Tax=Salipiger profundus TaxID=1229727 RepID=A0A1U7D9Y5_9RHOB|nr:MULTISPECIES: NADH:flavin oxidoreductase/NADH oxidase [Salipiger]APX24922.1 NADH:flavin oxidoreductase [Salipiger profundus]MAB07835.1 NADH:flavin oxidoreductase/NADH oxidase [Paracoccaceae bacterium]GFZ98867.1 NADH:flavin oxidoreductase / NADH oxidase [Salipiger profundus]SFC95053.1 2,4-dienoyl-CoA reductase [Salipiger profundus]
MSKLAQSLSLRGVTLPNRVMVSPMCTYGTSGDGVATDWHFAHYGRLAMGGAGMVMLEATSIDPVGRHSYADLGIWTDEQAEALGRIAGFIKAQGSVAAIQLQHAGRKSSARRPWHGGAPLTEEDIELRGEHPWQAVGPSPVAVGEGKPVPAELSAEDLPRIVQMWVDAAKRAVDAGFDIIEVHSAHGYLLNQFLSPIANRRNDAYGGELENRMRFPLEVISAVRAVIPEDKPLLVRISAVDGVDEGWTLEESVIYGQRLREIGVDAIDCSSGGIGGAATMNRLARFPGFQLPLSQAVRESSGLPTVGVGLIFKPQQAEDALEAGQADIIAIGRECLNNPNWPDMALTELDPARSYAHWQPGIGWWLEKRESIIRTYEEEMAAAERESA